MAYTRNTVVKQAKAWIGCKESDGSHKEIIDVYNAHTPLARSYKVQYTDAWCATFVSAVAIKVGYTAIIPTECSCDKMIALFKNLSEWKEDDSYTPDAGDVIFYDWQDTTGSSSDNTGSSDHVGIVEKVSGTTITVIEGNYSDSVKRRTLQVNGKYIRGYGLPKYTESSSNTTATTSSTTKASATDTAKPKAIWTYLLGKIGNAYGVAGLMGNLYAESGLVPNNLQNSYNTKLGYTDAAYTAAVDDGSYTKFSSDSAGYGLAQWTYSTRKKALKAYADKENASIGNLDMQLAFLYKEMKESYSSVLTTLKNATSVLEASNAVLTKYEKPADQSTSVQTKRAAYGQTYYDKYAGTSTSGSSSSTSSLGTGTKITLSGIAIYASATASSKSGTKTGTFYIWSATTSNGRIRITNSSSNVGKSGKVTGWMNVTDISTTTSTSTSSSSSAPSYKVDGTYTLQVDKLNVRKGAGTSYAKVTYANLTTNAKANAYSNGTLKKGTKVTCKAVKTVGSDIWMQIPSGWIAAYYSGTIYVK